MEDGLKCCFTGYRPAKMPFKEGDSVYTVFENTLIEKLIALSNENCNTFYTGMAMGFDIIAAESVLLIKNAYPNRNIKLVCVIPFQNQAGGFDKTWRERYNRILNACDEKILLNEEYFRGCYQVRNKYMVDNCDFVLTWYDGQRGGTRNTVEYALKSGRQVININNQEIEGFAVQNAFELL